MRNSKNPFVNGTVQEVLSTESDSYIIRIADSFYEHEGSFTFSKTQATKHYKVILTNILVALKQGTAKEKKAANICLLNLHVQPLRIH